MRFKNKNSFCEIHLSKSEVLAIFASISFLFLVFIGLVVSRFVLQSNKFLTDEKYKTLDLVNQSLPSDVANALKTGTFPFFASRSSQIQDGQPAEPQYRIPIFMYHYVEYVHDTGDHTRILLNTPPRIIEEQIRTLLQNGYAFITAKELGDIIDRTHAFSGKPVLFTFDDGYGDFYTDVFPILKKFGIKATVYIISEFLDKPNYMTKKQVHEVVGSGLVEIGDHTLHHLALRGLKLDQVTKEIAQSKVLLEKEFGQPITDFCYPYGSFDVQAISVVKSLGYKTATTTLPGTIMSHNERFILPRLRAGGRTGKALMDWLTVELNKNANSKNETPRTNG